MSKSTIVTVLSYLLLISSAACFVATMSAAYVPIMVVSIFGFVAGAVMADACLLYTSPSPRDRQKSRMPSSA